MSSPDWDMSTRGIARQRRTNDPEKERLAQALRDGDTATFTAAIRKTNRPSSAVEGLDGIRALDAVLGMMENAEKGDTWPEMIDTAKYVIETEGLAVLEARVAETQAQAEIDEDWSCIDCGIPLEPGAPPICEECVEA